MAGAGRPLPMLPPTAPRARVLSPRSPCQRGSSNGGASFLQRCACPRSSCPSSWRWRGPRRG
eukprot:64764-Pyramimonas_sp.AAC.1